MGDIIMTSGSGIEGYEIKDYLGLISGQTALNAKFFSEFTNNVEMDEKESKELTKKLSAVHEKVFKLLEEEAIKREANAVIGITIRYNELTSGITNNNTIGIIAVGTAVKVKEKPNRKYEGVSQELYVTNYYTKLPIRPVELRIKADKSGTRISPVFMNYNNEDIKAIRADIELSTYYDEKIFLSGVDFTFEKSNLRQLNGDWTDCDIKERDVKLIRDAKVIIRKYVTSKEVRAVEDEFPITTELSYRRLVSLKKKRGIDAVKPYSGNDMIWNCVCGHINKVSDDCCEICGRKEEELNKDIGFDYEAMLKKLRELETVRDVKDTILADYIKEINPDDRMQVLETLESALQYEKTRGDMKEYVLEKLLDLFED